MRSKCTRLCSAHARSPLFRCRVHMLPESIWMLCGNLAANVGMITQGQKFVCSCNCCKSIIDWFMAQWCLEHYYRSYCSAAIYVCCHSTQPPVNTGISGWAVRLLGTCGRFRWNARAGNRKCTVLGWSVRNRLFLLRKVVGVVERLVPKRNTLSQYELTVLKLSEATVGLQLRSALFRSLTHWPVQSGAFFFWSLQSLS